MKQWNGNKMRKWSHTFSRCSKTSHPHSTLIDHGSCCHIAHAKLSFLWISRKSPNVSDKLILWFGLVFVFFLFLFLRETQYTTETVPHMPFPESCHETERKLSRSQESCPYGKRMKLCLRTTNTLSH